MKIGITVFVLLSLFYAAVVWAVPVAPIEVEITQPDGTKFIAIARGDEYATWVETSEGHTIVKAGDTWFYARSDGAGGLAATSDQVGGAGTARAQSRPLHLAPTPDPDAFVTRTIRQIPRSDTSSVNGLDQLQSISHTQYLLTILVNYSDISFTYSDDSFEALIYGASNSVRDFYLENSYNGFAITAPAETYGTVNDGVIHVTRPVIHPNQGTDYNVSRAEAREIVQLANPYINYASYDADGNGKIDAEELSILIITAGYEGGYGGPSASTPNVHGHQTSFSSITLDNVSLSPYTIFGEAHAINAPPTGKHQATIGVMVHELGHLMLGLPDLYDYDQSSDGIGDWGLMGSGSWNQTGSWRGDSPSHLSAWSKVKTRFTIPQDIDSNQGGVRLARADTSEDAKRIWIDKYKSELSYEYFLVENRQQFGYDAGLPGGGLLIWHIDDEKTTNEDEGHKWVDLEEADGLAELDTITELVTDNDTGDGGDAFFDFCFVNICVGNTTFSNTSNPNSKNYAGAATQIVVTNISSPGTTMTADIAAINGGTAFIGDHVRYDEQFSGAGLGFNPPNTTAWVGIRALNDTANTNFDGVDVFVNDDSGATIDIYYYSSMAGGAPSDLIHSQTGFSAGSGWNRLLLASPQPFPIGSERGIVLKIVNDSDTKPVTIDYQGPVSGRSYIDQDGTGTFISLSDLGDLDLNLVALLSGIDMTLPTTTVISPATTGPTNANSVSFAITFSEEVINFDNANDLIITHSGTAHTGVTVTGSGSSYNANVTGITGTGSFTLKVKTNSGVQDSSSNTLASSVTSAAVNIDNTAPTISIGSPSVNLTRSGPVTFTVNYSGANSVSLANAVSLNTSGTANGNFAVSGSGSASRTVTINNITGTGSLGISIAAGTAADTAGNSALSEGPSQTFEVDNTPPAATLITPATTGPTKAGSVSFGIVFSEAVVSFNDSSDVTITHSGTSHSGVTITGSGTSYSANVTGITGTGSFTLKVNTGSGTQDLAGNGVNSSVTSASVNVDNMAPTVLIGAPSASSTLAGPVSYSITYTDADSVTLANGDVTLNKSGTADGIIAISGSGSTTRVVTLSSITGTGTLDISIAAGTASDTAGNIAAAAGPGQAISVQRVDLIFRDTFE